MNAEPHDFRKPARLAGDLEQRLSKWLSDACALTPNQWVKQLPVPLEMSFRGLETIRPADGLAKFTEATVGHRVTVNGDEMHTLLVLPRPFVLALVNLALGDASLELPPDRELTTVEDAVYEYLIQRLLFSVFQDTWPGTEPLQLTLGAKEPQAKWAKLFASGENLVIGAFVVAGASSDQELHWIVPQKGLLDQLSRTAPTQETPQDVDSQGRLKALVCDLAVEVSVVLGEVEVSAFPALQLESRRCGAPGSTGFGASAEHS